jgi:putative ABC transport system permease protein
MNLALRLYRWLARAFPHEFKLVYGPEMAQLGEDVVKQIARRHGVVGLIRPIADIAIRVPIEYFDEMRSDMRYALRAMAKSPGFALVGIVSMGLGMGLTTVVYSTKWLMVTRELPAVANARRLVMPEKPVSYSDIERFRGQKALFAGVAAYKNGVPFNVTFQGDADAKPQRVFGQLVSADYFSVMGVRPQRGRVLDPEQDKPGNTSAVVVSDRFWRHRLNASPNAVGQTLRLNGQPATIVGITPKNFNGAFAMNPAELFVPVTAPASLAPELENDVLHRRNAREFLALICLAPNVTRESAEAALDAITRQIEREDPSVPVRAAADTGRRVTLLEAGTMTPLPRRLKAVVAGFFVVLMGLIMIIACMNLANMLLARGARRRKELAIRLAVGASRFRLVRQMMNEGILLALMGGVAGFAMAYGLAVVSAHFELPTVVPLEADLAPDWRAGVFVFVLSAISGIGFSLMPALRATKGDVTPALKAGSPSQLPGYLRFGLRNLLMVVQVAGSLMLLLITGFLVIGINRISTVQTKVDPHQMLLLSMDPVRDGETPEKAIALFEKLPERLKTVGGVQSMALAAQPPFAIQEGATRVTAEQSHGSPRVLDTVVEETVGAGYFAALAEPMLAGREFEERDQASPASGSPPHSAPVVLNETAARRLFGSDVAVGRRLRDDKQSYEVVGVVHDLKRGLGFRQSALYLPLTRLDFARPPAGGMTILVRMDAGADALAAIRSEIALLDPKLNLFHVQTLADYLEQTRSAIRFSVHTYGGIGLFGLVLAAVGLAGVTAYAVAQRRKEIGIRMALGARQAQVLRLVLREGVALVAAGTVLGFLGAFALAKVLSALMSEIVESMSVGTNEPRLLLGAPLLLAALAMLACYLPARQATRIDPLKALRSE